MRQKAVPAGKRSIKKESAGHCCACYICTQPVFRGFFRYFQPNMSLSFVPEGFASDLGRIKFAIDAAGIGVWELDLQTRTVFWDERCCTFLGLRELRPAIALETILQKVHPGDMAGVARLIEAAMAGRVEKTFDFTCRVQGDDKKLRWLRTTGTSYFDEKGQMIRLGGVVRDVSERRVAQSQARASQEQTLSLLNEMPMAIANLSRADLSFTNVNRLYCDLVGYEPDQLIGKPLTDVFPETKESGLLQMLHQVMDTGTAFTLAEEQMVLRRQGQNLILYANFSFQAVRDEEGVVSSVLVALTDVTPQVEARKKIEASANRFQNLVHSASVGIILLSGPELRVDMVNEAYCRIVGNTPAGLLHQPLFRIIPESEAYYRPIIEKVRDTGTEHHLLNAPFEINHPQGAVLQGYVNVVYQPYREEKNGPVTGVLILLYEVTEQVVASQRALESEARFRTLIEEAPFATALYTGPELIIDIANDEMIRLWGKTPAVIGMPLAQALPELEGQPFIGLLQEVFRTGVPYRTQEQEARLVVNGVLQAFWFNFTYKPLLNAEGKVYAILNMAVNITAQVLARKKVDESETNLAAAIELAELGTWSMELPSGKMTYSPRLQKWLGLDAAVVEEGVSPRVHEKDRARIAAAIRRAVNPENPERYDEVYTIVHAVTGVPRIIHATGRLEYDSAGKPVRLSGTAQDITLQRDLQSALENEVQLRTEQLDAAFNELQVTNDALASLNEKLKHSNEELAQYAYVASHDLQEPLRKIQIFSDLLQGDRTMSARNQELVNKIVGSSARMSQLIRDLLDFSRLLQPDKHFQPVNLDVIVANVCSDYELVAAEKKAEFRMSPMPQLEAVSLQMRQLFYNLIGNSLKFTRPGVAPVVTLTASEALAAEVQQYIRLPQPETTYYKICIADNGIGFEEDYSEKIFEVFKRLHTREAYPGSGIGLALCRRIVANHGGALYSYSTPGKGATFCLLLPQNPAQDSPLQTGAGISGNPSALAG